MTLNMLLAGLIFLLAVTISIISLMLTTTPRWLLSLLLAIVGVIVSVMALAQRIPFYGYFPEIAYSYSSYSISISLRSGWLFIIPLLLSIITLFRLVRTRSSADNTPNESLL